MANETWFAIGAVNDASAEVRIYGTVGVPSPAGMVTAAAFTKSLGEIRSQVINLRLNTDGGSILEGVAIYNALKNHGARIVAHIDGVAASIGSYIAMAAHEVRMAKNAWLMIHNPKAMPQGMPESRDLRRMADTLDKMRDTLRDAYVARTSLPPSEIEQMMEAETWLTAEEAKAKGFADVITNDNAVMVAMSNLSAFSHVPEVLKPVASAAEPNVTPAPEASPSGEPAPAQPQEVTPMADTQNQAAPASNPAPANDGTPQGDITLPPATGTVQDAIRHFQNVAGPAYIKQGHAKGLTEGYQAAVDRLKAIAEVCPNKPQMALTAFLAGQSPEAVKLAVEETARVEAAAKLQAEAHQMQIAQLHSLIAIGGHPGVGLGLSNDTPTGLEPKAQAAYEWDHDPKVREGFTSKENYVNIRTDELTGRFRMQKVS